MPHNRTRIWIGVLITAVTIPAVGRYYSSPSQDGQSNRMLTVADVEGVRGVVAAPGQDRDYQGEVDAAISRRGGHAPKVPMVQTLDPLVPGRPIQPPLPINNPSPIRVASTSTPAATTTEADPIEDTLDATPPDNGGMSDRTVYSIVVDNLSADDRDTFERSWALMSAQERTDMLDDFRTKLQSK